VLLDLHRQLMGPVSAGGLRATSLQLIEHIAAECKHRGLSLICVDEAQMLSAANLELLRQVPDKARAEGHPLGLLVAGSEELRDTLVSIQQLGQRFASEIRMHPLSDHDFTKHWTGLHPHLPPMRAGMAKRDWTRLEAHVRTAVAGKMRRLAFLLENANALALQWNRPVDEAILRAAASRLAPER
jgi:DNA transposition AAA+ family ATPase